MKIDKKIVLGFVAITVMIIAVTATSFVSFNNFVKLFNQTQEKIQLAKFTTEKEIDHLLWADNISKGLIEEKAINITLDPTACGIGKWIYQSLQDKNFSPEVMKHIHELEPVHKLLHESGKDLLDQFSQSNIIPTTNRTGAINYYAEHTAKHLVKVRERVGDIKEALNHEVVGLNTSVSNTTKFVFTLLIAVSIVAILASIFFGLTSARGLFKFAKNLLQSSSKVVQTSQDIASRNQELASRTEEQASSLEETASTLEEVTATVKQTTDNTSKASKLAKDVLDNAKEGSNTSKDVQTAMNEITTSSQKIAQIVDMVDEIAFQTNILAINAAIEAAKAGDLGKGFAVVAIEVRDLAQRSSDAAKDIKNLIDTSIGKVENGSMLVKSNGEKLEEITEGIQKVNDIMLEISAATNQQYSAIQQINTAVTQIDTVTQDNSRMVEEVAHFSENMNGVAQEMDKAIKDNLSV